MVFSRVELGGIRGLLGAVGLPWRPLVSGVYFLEFLPNIQKLSVIFKTFEFFQKLSVILKTFEIFQKLSEI